jgi:hypothetical protein
MHISQKTGLKKEDMNAKSSLEKSSIEKVT